MENGPKIYRNNKELILDHIYPKRDIFFIHNASINSPAMPKIIASFEEAFKEEGYRMVAIPSFYFFDYAESFEDVTDKVLYYDKDLILARRLEAKGIRVYNKASSIEICDSKIKTGLFLYGSKIATIPFLFSSFCFESRDLNENDLLVSSAISKFGLPLVIKEEYGSLGQQVYLAKTGEEAFSITRSIAGNKRFLLEPYLENHNEDHRLYIVDDEVIGAIRRHNPNDFRSNVEAGGSAYPYEPTLEERELALRAVRALGMDYAGVDILLDQRGKPLIGEINSAPHFLGLRDATGIDMAKEIVRRLF